MQVIERIDLFVTAWLRRWATRLLRISLGAVFVWFGGLKVLDVSPVSELVADTVYWVDPNWFVPVRGVTEIIGTLLVLGKALRIALLVFGLQMIGTALVFVVLPEVAFTDGNPLRLTVEGEFVAKNLVLLTAGLVVGAGVRPLSRAPEAELAVRS